MWADAVGGGGCMRRVENGRFGMRRHRLSSHRMWCSHRANTSARMFSLRGMSMVFFFGMWSSRCAPYPPPHLGPKSPSRKKQQHTIGGMWQQPKKAEKTEKGNHQSPHPQVPPPDLAGDVAKCAPTFICSQRHAVPVTRALCMSRIGKYAPARPKSPRSAGVSDGGGGQHQQPQAQHACIQ